MNGDLRGRQRSADAFARQRDAERARRRAEAQIADGKFVNLATGRQRFARYVTEVWLPNHVMEGRTQPAPSFPDDPAPPDRSATANAST
ncbi:hypothetical protein SAMN05216215_103734 [Saccharopolyspora shandongensis]|uniref:Uncharacterized protein n=1 Tax=Saccharopolyspora shandongensis TaxID=418495 RepID=A0A1H3NAP4_9PSEU|nr:hypothetical protein [Saccharopolyspora shandongensis]SDY85824.1 hypothetical protein SAMN05216215_103734 [Saccharopolyspora shandongensis]